MKNPLFTTITDLHIDDSNYNEVQVVVRQAIDKTVALGLKVIYVGGDVFNSRKNQTFNVLQTFLEILDYAHTHNIVLRTIPGNHDKLDYTSVKSYLDAFAYHPAMELTTSHQSYVEGNFIIHMVPFFDEKSTYKYHFDKIKIRIPEDPNSKSNFKNILITHIAVNGVKNNDGSEIEDSTKNEIFAPFFKVLIGHYHNMQKVGSKLYYIGSIMQKNYGEDDQKGMTIFYDDGSHELFQLDFIKFKTIKVDLDEVDGGALKQMLVDKSQNEDHVKIKFSGKRETLDAFDKSRFVDAGFDIKYEYNVVVDLSYKQAEEFTGFDKDKIKDEWSEFTITNEEIDNEIGIVYLEQVL